jgi:hypothetical protein
LGIIAMGRHLFPNLSRTQSRPGSRKELLERKGFREDGNIDGVFYRHPIYGLVAIKPGGGFRTAYIETTFSLDAFPESLPDSKYHRHSGSWNAFV